MSDKKSYERAVKKSVSMPELLLDDAQRRRNELRLPTLSDYIQFLIRRDTTRQQEEETRIAA
jgi:Arc/MetJ-type ribon-helix-helix transcriptional regulator